MSFIADHKMIQDEFIMIQNYLNNVLKKKWIYSSSNFAETSVLFIKKLNESFHLYVNYHDLNEIIVNVKRKWVSTDISDSNDDNVECIVLSTRMSWLYRSAESSELDSSW